MSDKYLNLLKESVVQEAGSSKVEKRYINALKKSGAFQKGEDYLHQHLTEAQFITMCGGRRTHDTMIKTMEHILRMKAKKLYEFPDEAKFNIEYRSFSVGNGDMIVSFIATLTNKQKTGSITAVGQVPLKAGSFSGKIVETSGNIQ